MADKKGNTGSDNTGENNSGNWNSGDCNSGYRNSGNWNSGNWNSGYRNSGDWNSGNRNSGLFNSNEPYARMFNRETKVKLSEFINTDAYPDFSDFSVCVWVEESIMTDYEKEENPTYKTTGGYIKKLEYKKAWSVFWRKTSEANKEKILALPNFDADIFEKITGIKVDNDNEAKQKAKELREQADKLLQKAKELESSL